MKKYLLTLSVLFLSLFSSTTYASNECYTYNEGPYAGLIGGWTNFSKLHNLDFHDGYYVGGVLGYKFCNQFRIEGELSYQRNESKSFEMTHRYLGFSDNGSVEFKDCTLEKTKLKGHLRSWSYMANVLYDFNVNCLQKFLLTPYVGLGVGYTHFTSHLNDYVCQGHKTCAGRFAYQAIAGLKYQVSPTLEVGVDYRYLSPQNSFKSHRVGLVLTQAF